MSIYVKHILSCEKIEQNGDGSVTLVNSFVNIKGSQLPILKPFYLFIGVVLMEEEVDGCTFTIKGPNKEEIVCKEFPIQGKGVGTLDEYIINMGTFPFEKAGVYYFNIYDKTKGLVGMHRIKVLVEEDEG
jgi:hypothetical protein